MMIIKPDPPFKSENTLDNKTLDNKTLSNKKGALPENPKIRAPQKTALTDQMAAMKHALSNMPDIDDAHIAEMKAEIAQDTFSIDTLSLAQAMIDYHRR